MPPFLMKPLSAVLDKASFGGFGWGFNTKQTLKNTLLIINLHNKQIKVAYFAKF